MEFKKKYIILICIIFSGCTSVNKTNSNEKINNLKTIKTENNSIQMADKNHRMEDLQFLYETLQKEQSYFDETNYNNRIKDIESKISDLDDIEFYFEIKRILAAANDSHMRAFLNNDTVVTIFPIWSIKKIDDKWFVYGIQKNYEDYLKKELISINGYLMKDIEKLAKPYISHENNIYFNTMFAEEIKTAEFLKYIGIINDIKTIPVSFKDEEGKILNTEIKTFPSDDNNSYSGAWLNTPKTSRNWDKNYYFAPLDLDSSTLFIQYSVCKEDENQSIKDFQQELLKELQKKIYKNVIFDLRYNQGGVYNLFSSVIDTIGQSKNELKFNLYCLIGEETFSTGVLHAVQLQKYGAVTVGTPTGGNVNFYADTKTVILPNSGINVSYSTQYEQTIEGYDKDCLYPDINVEQSVYDYADGIDCDIKAIYNLVK